MFRTISVQQLEYLLDGERTFTLLDVREQRNMRQDISWGCEPAL